MKPSVAAAILLFHTGLYHEDQVWHWAGNLWYNMEQARIDYPAHPRRFQAAVQDAYRLKLLPEETR